MPLPSLSPEQRSAALEKAAEVRRARAELKDQLKSGKADLATILRRAEADDVVGKLKVRDVLQAMPGIGKIRAQQIMERLKIADSRRLRGLGEQQRKALLGEFASSGKRPQGRNEQWTTTTVRARRLGSRSCPALPGSAKTA